MIFRIGFALVLAGVSTSAADAQQNPSPDSLVAHFIDRGALASWLPHRLFEGCPSLHAWQNRGIELLVAADLSRERTNDLARSWMIPLRRCSSTRLEQWYFEHLNAAMRRGDSADRMLTFWTALEFGDSPGIREYLEDLMLDESKPESYRDLAGAMLFVRLGREEKLRTYLRAFDTGRMPSEVAWGQTAAVLEQDADRLHREVGRRVRANPALADQMAFRAVVESGRRYASAAARRDLAEALRAGLVHPGLNAGQRRRLEGAVEFLLQPTT